MTSVVLPRLRFKNFPSAFTILFIITLLAVACTWMIPAGAYSKLTYSAESGMLSMATPSGDVTTLAATQEELDKLGVNIKIDQF
ncbi:hypothetical protein AKJ18_35865, partial [Vibrio xuii]